MRKIIYILYKDDKFLMSTSSLERGLAWQKATENSVLYKAILTEVK